MHSATLTITSVQRSDQGGYRCIVYNDTGSETSEPAVVTVGRYLEYRIAGKFGRLADLESHCQVKFRQIAESCP